MTDTSTAAEGKLVQDLITKLGNLDDDGRQRVMQTVATYYGLGFPRLHVPIEAAQSGTFASSGSDIGPRFSEHEDIDPRHFLLEKRPATDVERVACLAYYLEHLRGMRQFKTLDISKLNTEAAQPKFSNPSVAISNAVRSGFLGEAAKGYKQLSAPGEHFVLALPDREAAREALKRARRKRQKRRPVAKSHSVRRR